MIRHSLGRCTTPPYAAGPSTAPPYASGSTTGGYASGSTTSPVPSMRSVRNSGSFPSGGPPGSYRIQPPAVETQVGAVGQTYRTVSNGYVHTNGPARGSSPMSMRAITAPVRRHASARVLSPPRPPFDDVASLRQEMDALQAKVMHVGEVLQTQGQNLLVEAQARSELVSLMESERAERNRDVMDLSQSVSGLRDCLEHQLSPKLSPFAVSLVEDMDGLAAQVADLSKFDQPHSTLSGKDGYADVLRLLQSEREQRTSALLKIAEALQSECTTRAHEMRDLAKSLQSECNVRAVEVEQLARALQADRTARSVEVAEITDTIRMEFERLARSTTGESSRSTNGEIPKGGFGGESIDKNDMFDPLIDYKNGVGDTTEDLHNRSMEMVCDARVLKVEGLFHKMRSENDELHSRVAQIAKAVSPSLIDCGSSGDVAGPYDA